MSLETTALTQGDVVIVAPKRRSLGVWIVSAALLVLAATVGARAWESGFRLHDLWRERAPELALFDVDEGELEVFVTETGTLESATNSKVKCQVESLLGNVGGTSGASGGAGTSGTRAGGTTGAGGTGGASGTGGAQSGGSSTTQSTTTKSKSSSRSKSGTASKSSSGSGAGSNAAGSTSTASASAGSSSTTGSDSTSGSGGGGTTIKKKPTIRSFTYQVAKHVPLRGTSTKSAQSTTKSTSTSSGAGGGGGRRGGGGGGGGGGNRGGGGGGAGGTTQTPGSTTIIAILPEGTHVKADEIVCELDSASFRDELQAQKIKHAQAKSWVDQARSIYEVNQITYREYKEGIIPQDELLIKQYIQTCELELQSAQKVADWSKETLAKGFRATAQYNADAIVLERAKLALDEAKGMDERLKYYTGPRLLKSLEAKLQSIRADMLAQEAAFGIEDDRLHRLEKMIANCTIRAPREGIVVYANESNPWSGRTDVQIQEGVTVRENQALFDLPDPNHMRVKVKINESKMASIRSGQRALIQVEAFPDKLMTGSVTEITPIPAVLGRFSDIRIYFAYVKLDAGGFVGLRPGMTAEVSFFVESKEKAVRVPVQAVRWVRGQAFVAVASKVDDEVKWDWRSISLGVMNENFAQVVAGLKPGEQVVAQPDALPNPIYTQSPPAVQTAGTSGHAKQG